MMNLEAARREYERLQAKDKPFFVVTDVAPILGADAYAPHLQADRDASKLGFPVIVACRRIKIPKAAFLDYIEPNVLARRRTSSRLAPRGRTI